MDTGVYISMLCCGNLLATIASLRDRVIAVIILAVGIVLFAAFVEIVSKKNKEVLDINNNIYDEPRETN